MKSLNPSIKHHLMIGALLSAWAFLFAFFTRPFEHGRMDLQKWILVSVGYSLLVFLSYALVAWIQKRVFEKQSTWNNYYEIGTYILFYLIYTTATYLYYKSSLIEGIYLFPEYLVKIIINIILILTPLLFLMRRYSIKLIQTNDETIKIRGNNKLDILKIKKSELICISNAQNYVEIFFLDNDQLKTKLIRSSLKKINNDFDFLIQIHRSHLINPAHFKSWKDANNISLTQIDLPVSKNYKSQLHAL